MVRFGLSNETTNQRWAGRRGTKLNIRKYNFADSEPDHRSQMKCCEITVSSNALSSQACVVKILVWKNDVLESSFDRFTEEGQLQIQRPKGREAEGSASLSQ